MTCRAGLMNPYWVQFRNIIRAIPFKKWVGGGEFSFLEKVGIPVVKINIFYISSTKRTVLSAGFFWYLKRLNIFILKGKNQTFKTNFPPPLFFKGIDLTKND